MAISKGTDFWSARLNGQDPTAPVGKNNTAWTLDSGSSSNGTSIEGKWRVTGAQMWKQTVANDDNDLTIMGAISFTTFPSGDEDLLILDNGTHRVRLAVSAGTDKVKLRGATDALSDTLDLKMTDDYAVPIIFRLTLDSTGKGRLYMREMIEDDDAQQAYLEVTAGSSSSQGAFFGTTSSSISVDFHAVYYTSHGAYSPDEMDMSDFTSHSIMRTGMKVVEVLRNSNRLLLKTHVTDAGIFYAYDLSSNAMANRLPAPTVHVMVQKADSPDFLTLAGTRTDQRYVVNIFVTTRGTNYENAYRLGASILGEVFDELYTNTGLDAGVDSLISYDAVFDTKVDDDETVCIHSLSLTYMKKIRMFFREA